MANIWVFQQVIIIYRHLNTNCSIPKGAINVNNRLYFYTKVSILEKKKYNAPFISSGVVIINLILFTEQTAYGKPNL